jgi:cell division initiation protein
MKISPTAIRQKFFETAFRGFEKKQVTDFLEEISEIMQLINQENLELRSKLQLVEGEAKRLKDVEDSLFRTLKTAEDTGAAIITEATEAADQIIGEANQIAESTTSRAYKYAEQMKRQADEHAQFIATELEANARETFKEIRESLQVLIKSYDGLVEQRAALIKSLKRISQDNLNQIELSESHFGRIDSRAYQRAVDELTRSGRFNLPNGQAPEAEIKPVVPHADDESESQFEDELTSSRVEEEMRESVVALQHELEDLDELPGNEEHERQFLSIPTPSTNPVPSEDSAPQDDLPDFSKDDSKRSSGSFFDQFN